MIDMKVPIDFTDMKDAELLKLAKKSIRELNSRCLCIFKIVQR